MKSVSGIRGIVGDSLKVELVVKFARRFGIFCGKGKILVGRDSRTTGKMLFNAISSSLMSVGSDVVDLGICPTPTILLAVENSDAVGGIAITASHNPKEWNALKLVNHSGTFLTEKQSKLFWNFPEEKIVDKDWENIGKISSDNTAIENHIQSIMNLDLVDVQAIKKKNFTVVIDSTNGAGGVLSPELLRRLGCHVVELFSEPTGIFSREGEPLAINLTELEALVEKENADIGFATDPDVDRLSIVSEKGRALGTEYSLLLAEDYVLSQILKRLNPKKKNIATNLSSSMASDDIARKYGVQIFRSKVGEINVAEKMKENNCVIGGEGNGGIILPALHFTRDAPMGMALILSFLAKSGKSISELTSEIPGYFISKSKFQIDNDFDFNKIITRVKELYSDKKFDTTDGVKIINKNFWVHIRKSGTEPIVRIFAESESIEKSNALIKRIKNIL